MNPVIKVVAAREIRAKLHDRTFLISFAITLALLVGGVIAMHLVGNKNTTYDVAVADPQAAAIAKQAPVPKKSAVVVHEATDRAGAEALVRDGSADAALLPTDQGWELVGDSQLNPTLFASLSAAVAEVAMAENAAAHHVDLAQLSAGTELGKRLLNNFVDDQAQRWVFGFVMALLFYMAALMFGMQIAQAVVTEKESRVVEILAAAVPTRALLWGKMIGVTLVAWGQMISLVLAAVATLMALGNTSLLSGVGPAMGWFLAYFVLGFIALAALWAAGGAMSSRLQDVGSLTMPVQAVLLAGYLAGTAAKGTVSLVLSFVPILSPMVMPARIVAGGVPLWQILVSLLLNVFAALVLVRLGAAIYDRNLLKTGTKTSLGQAIRSLRSTP